MTAYTILPWHQSDWQRIGGSVSGQHHGLLLSGITGIGKLEFAFSLAKLLLCNQRTNADPCGICQDCRLFDAASHPDLHVLTSENAAVHSRVSLLGQYSERYQDSVARDKKVNPAQIIPVDQVRLLINRFYQSSQIATNRVALIFPADRMNTNAANALLKLLEEPPEGGFFILVADQPGLLPATVRSRCVLQTLSRPSVKEARQWLTQHGAGEKLVTYSDTAGVGPLHILAQQQNGEFEQQQENMSALIMMLEGGKDPVSLAASLSKQEILPLLQWIQQVLVEMIKWQSGVFVPNWAKKTAIDIAPVASEKLHAVYDKIGQYRLMARDQLNAQLALEELMIMMRSTLVVR